MGVFTAINALTAEIAKVVTKLTSVVTQLTAIAEACATLAINTTPADSDDTEPGNDSEP